MYIYTLNIDHVTDLDVPMAVTASCWLFATCCHSYSMCYSVLDVQTVYGGQMTGFVANYPACLCTMGNVIIVTKDVAISDKSRHTP